MIIIKLKVQTDQKQTKKTKTKPSEQSQKVAKGHSHSSDFMDRQAEKKNKHELTDDNSGKRTDKQIRSLRNNKINERRFFFF